jgi:hypothetical protein
MHVTDIYPKLGGLCLTLSNLIYTKLPKFRKQKTKSLYEISEGKRKI